MKIAIEVQRILRPNKHGMNFVTLGSVRELQKHDDDNEYRILAASGEDRCLEESSSLSTVEVKCPNYPLWEQIALSPAMKRPGADLLYYISNTAPLWCPAPLMLTFHDIIYPEPRQHRSSPLCQGIGQHYRRLIVSRILKRYRKIVTVSRLERERTGKALQIPVDRITAIYNGYSTHFSPLPEVDMHIIRQYIPEKGFLFFLSNTDSKKNMERVLKVYSPYLQRSATKYPLLITGLKEEYIDQVLQREGITDTKRHLYYPEYIPNSHPATLYNASFAFLYPSLRENLGIPLLEAVACGTPVVTGDTSAMPEVAGSSMPAVDPSKPEETTDRLLQLEQNPTLYQERKTHGL